MRGEGAMPSDRAVVAIGWVQSSLRHRADAPKQGYEGAPDARIRIDPAFRPGLDRLAAGQDLLVLTWLHQSRRDVLATHPRDDRSQPLTGVFATRSPDRPNPIGLHRCGCWGSRPAACSWCGGWKRSTARP